MNNKVRPTTTLPFMQPAPVSEDIKAVAATLGMLAGEIAEQDWMIVRMAIKNLLGSAEQVDIMERTFAVPQQGENSHEHA